MKKLLFVSAILFAIVTTSIAQDGERIFKKFKGDVSMGYATFPGNSDIKSGFIFALEPKYAVIDRLAIGFRYEINMLFKEVKTYDFYGNYSEDVKVKVYESFNLTTDYYFTDNYRVRPFIGAGGGLFLVSSTTTDQYNSGSNNDVTKTKFGGLVRGGVEIKHFRVGVEYNFVPASEVSETYLDYSGNSHYYTSTIKNSYLGIKLGFCFGGGPRDKN